MYTVDTVAMAARGQQLLTIAKCVDERRAKVADCLHAIRMVEASLLAVQLALNEAREDLATHETLAAELMRSSTQPTALSDENYPCRACGTRIDLGDICDACWCDEQAAMAETEAAIATTVSTEQLDHLRATGDAELAALDAAVARAGDEFVSDTEQAFSTEQASSTDTEPCDLQPGEPDRLARDCPVCAAEYADSRSTCPACRTWFSSDLAEPVDLDDEGTRQSVETPAEPAPRKCYYCQRTAAGRSRLCVEHQHAKLPGRKPSEATVAKRAAEREANRKDLHWDKRGLGNAKRGTTEAALEAAKQPVLHAALIEQLVQDGHGDRGAVIEVIRQAINRGLLLRDGHLVVAAKSAEVAHAG